MSNGLLGMDVHASRELAVRLEAWPNSFDDVVALISEAEMLSDIPVGVTALLDSIGGDGASMAAAIRRAADALESFTINLGSPLAIAAAVASVKAFRGSDNDPELDKRLRVLRGLVAQGTTSDVDTARVMSQLLAATNSVDVRYSDTSEVTAARAEVERYNHLEATGAISSNDPRIDESVRHLRDVLAGHAATTEQANELLYAFVADSDGDIATSTLLAAVLTGASVEAVRVAHAHDVDYDVADGIIKLDRVDRLTESMNGASISAIDRMAAERRELLVDLAGSGDVEVIASLTEQLDNEGVSAIDAFGGLGDHLAERADRAHRASVELVAEAHDLDYAAAEVRLADMAEGTNELVAGGASPEDAAIAVQIAMLNGLDLGAIEAVASAKHMTLEAAAYHVARADHFGFTPVELDAYDGLNENFSVFDNARGGDTDGTVSLWDVAHVVNNPDDFAPGVLAAAAALLAAPGVRDRLDSARDEGGVIGYKAFGADRPDDHKYSLTDMANFENKQYLNYVLRNEVDAIDVASQGGDLSRVDGKLRKEDFEAFLVSAEGQALDGESRNAIQTVIDADWYDQNLWQEHGDAIIYWAGFAVGVAAGSAVFVATAGTAGPVVVALLTTAAGAAAGAGTGAALTLGENLLTGDPLGEDLLANTVGGAAGGTLGGGVVAAVVGAPASTVAGRVATAVGRGADVAGMVAAGGADPFLDIFMDDMAMRELGDDAQFVNYLAGAGSIGLYGNAVRGSRAAASAFDGFDNIANAGLQRITTSPTIVGRAAAETVVQNAVGDVTVAAGQRLLGVGLDAAAAAADD